mgnify:CR=1 FL=1
MDKIRIDKWLWAARFFKTRNLAKQAIDGGKVHCDGQRVKPSKDLMVGQVLSLRQGWDEKTVTVIALSGQRRGAPEAEALYCETAESLAKRETRAAERKAQQGTDPLADGRPSKKQRRQIHRFKSISAP